MAVAPVVVNGPNGPSINGVPITSSMGNGAAQGPKGFTAPDQPGTGGNAGYPADPGATLEGGYGPNGQTPYWQFSPLGTNGWPEPPAAGADKTTTPTKQTGPSAADLAAIQALAEANKTPEFMTPQMQSYVNQFHQSQANMQQALNSGLAQALTGLKSRRDAASRVVATLPGQAKTAYDQASGSAVHAANAARVAAGGPTIGGASSANDIAAANSGALAASKTSQPLLQAGITADYSKGVSTLDNTHLANEATWNQTNTEFAGQMAHDQAAFDAATESQKAGMIHDIQMAELNTALGIKTFKAENPNKSLTPAQQEQQSNTAQLDQQAIKSGFANYAQQKATEALPAYQQVVDVLTSKTGLNVNGKNIQPGDRSILKYVTDPLILKALVANGVVSAADMQGLYGQSASTGG